MLNYLAYMYVEIGAVPLPQFTDDEKGLYFSLDPLEEQIVNEIRTYTAKTFFILQLGYFKANKQFFVFSLQTVADDAAYLLRRYFPQVPELSDLTISKPTRLAQQTEILRLLRWGQGVENTSALEAEVESTPCIG